MKSDLIITRFKTEPSRGTKDATEKRTYFGSKMVSIEDTINIDDRQIQYSEILDNHTPENNGYQHFNDIDNKEFIYLINLYDVKSRHHKINLLSQPLIDIKNNTQWQININWKNILRDYIFYQLKRSRTFKCISYTDVLNENINLYIRDYININLLNRYKLQEIKFYIKFYDLEVGDEFDNPNLSFNPLFEKGVKEEKYNIKNINSKIIDDNLVIDYKQTEPSISRKFNYYFDLIFRKI